MNQGTEVRKVIRSNEDWWPDGWPEDPFFGGDAPMDMRHGTSTGYGYHRRTDYNPCKPCRDAWNIYQNGRRVIRQAKYKTSIERAEKGEAEIMPPTKRKHTKKVGYKVTPNRTSSANNLRIYQLALRRLAAEHPEEFEFYREEITEEIKSEKK